MDAAAEILAVFAAPLILCAFDGVRFLQMCAKAAAQVLLAARAAIECCHVACLDAETDVCGEPTELEPTWLWMHEDI